MNLVGSRRLEPELMDDPGLDDRRHRVALRALARLNVLSQAHEPVWQAIEPLLGDGRTLRLLDVATGSGDVPVRIGVMARKAGCSLEVAGCDKSPVAVGAAKERAAAAGVSARFFTCDVLGEPLERGHDVVTCSLFLHHLDEAGIVALLRSMGEAAGAMVVACDLRRTVRGLLLAAWASRLTTMSHIVHTDAVLSARAALTIEELRELAVRAGLEGAQVHRAWPSRMVLVWRRQEHT